MKPTFSRMIMIFTFLTAALDAFAEQSKIAGALTPTPYGIIYSRNSWSNTSDFITNGNTTAVLDGSYVNISSATSDDWNNTVHITSYRTKLEKWHFKLRFKIIAWSGNSYGLGFGLKSANQYVQNDIMGFLQTANSGTGGLYIVKSGRTIVASGSTALGVALNDVIDMEGIFYDSVFHFTAHNITSGAMANVSFTYATNGSTHVVPNTSHFSLMELGGTHQVQNIEISSEELTAANIVTVGDSKTIGYFSNSFAGRYAAQLNNIYPAALINAGGADRVTHVLERQQELTTLAPAKFLLNIGSNDLRFGSTMPQLQYNYDSLVQLLSATGATVYHLVLPEDYTKPLGVNMVSFKNWVATTYPATYINVWDSMANGNYLKGIYDTGDGVHINQAGNDKIYEAIVASNKLNGGTLAIRLLSFDGARISNTKAILNWKLDPFQQAEKYDLLKSEDGNNFKQVVSISSNSGAIYDYTDNNLLPGTNYYMLRMIENTIDTVFSKLVLVRNGQYALQLMGLQKSGGQDWLFYLGAHQHMLITWQVIDVSGRKLKQGVQQLYKGINNLRIAMAETGTGIYFLKISMAGNPEAVSFPFMK